MRRLFMLLVVLAAASAGAFVAWRRNPRIGTRLMNRMVNPFLVERGVSGVGRSELGTLEHVGRRTGTRHLTPLHPVPTEDGFRIVVPLGAASEWARNVMASGRCRLQWHDAVYELDLPVLLPASEVEGMPPLMGRWLDLLGVQYLLLHQAGTARGPLAALEVPPATQAEPAAEPVLAGTG